MPCMHGEYATGLRTSRITNLRMRTSRIRKVRTCGCGFKNLEKSLRDLRLRTKLFNVQLRTCGYGSRKVKFGCGFADCGLKKNLRCPALGISHCAYWQYSSIADQEGSRRSGLLLKLEKHKKAWNA